MENNNLAIWNQVEKTSSKNVKPVTNGGRTYSSINPTSQKKKATEVFGAYGQGWGIEPESERYEYKEFNGGTILIIYRATMFYKFNGETGRLPISASEKLAYVTDGGRGYLRIDDEAEKKVRTNATTKGLSELGFNADIFLGQWDDAEYKAMRDMEDHLARTENFEVEQKKGIDELRVWINREMETLAVMKNVNTVSMVTNKIEEKFRTKAQLLKISQELFDSMIGKLHKTADEAISKLKSIAGE